MHGESQQTPIEQGLISGQKRQYQPGIGYANNPYASGSATPYGASSPVDSSLWPVRVMDPYRVAQLFSGFRGLLGIAKKIRITRCVCLAAWCLVVTGAVYGAFRYWQGNPELLEHLPWVPFVVAGVLAVFTVPLLWWARYPDYTTEELNELHRLEYHLMDVERVSAQDLCRAYGFNQLMQCPDWEDICHDTDGDTHRRWRTEKVDYFEFPKDAGFVRFPAAFRREALPVRYEFDDSTVDHGEQCIVEVWNGRVRIIPDDGSFPIRAKGAIFGIESADDPVNGVRSGKKATVVFRTQDAVRLHRRGIAARMERNPLGLQLGFPAIATAFVLPVVGVILGMVSIALAKKSFRKTDRFFSIWFGAWSFPFAACGAVLGFVAKNVWDDADSDIFLWIFSIVIIGILVFLVVWYLIDRSKQKASESQKDAASSPQDWDGSDD